MRTKHVFLLGLFFPPFLSAQVSPSNQRETDNTIEKTCEGPIFTATEQLPSLTITKEAFEDTLASTLKSKNVYVKDKMIRFKFILTKDSQILDLNAFTKGEIPAELYEIIRTFSRLWRPARQMGKIVCAYIFLDINFSEDKLSIIIWQHINPGLHIKPYNDTSTHSGGYYPKHVFPKE
ncbi:MAG: hypothetical protein ABI760_05425 [Ferruginibacter sp.]